MNVGQETSKNISFHKEITQIIDELLAYHKDFCPPKINYSQAERWNLEIKRYSLQPEISVVWVDMQGVADQQLLQF